MQTKGTVQQAAKTNQTLNMVESKDLTYLSRELALFMLKQMRQTIALTKKLSIQSEIEIQQ